MSDPIKVVCPQCAAANRVPAARLHEQPVCGRCKSALFAGTPVELSAESFHKHIANSDLPVLVDFWAPWCGPCRSMAPTFATAAARLEPGVRLVKLNTEEHGALAAHYNIRSIPTLALFRGGVEVARTSGALPLAQLLQFATQAG